MYCPTQDDNRSALLALLPRGRAWLNEDGSQQAGSVIYKFWDAAASVFTFLTDRLCALRLEMFCQTQTETRDLWLADYGLPDPCDPFPDLCAKVAALGGSRCDYFREIAARAGWNIDCEDQVAMCGAVMGCAYAGCAQAASVYPTCTLTITVDLGTSEAYSGAFNSQPFMGCFELGRMLGCEPDIGPLKCIIERVAPAHVTVQYVTLEPPIYIAVSADADLGTESGASIIAGVLT